LEEDTQLLELWPISQPSLCHHQCLRYQPTHLLVWEHMQRLQEQQQAPALRVPECRQAQLVIHSLFLSQ
jgi:hypothetical protein